MQHHTQSLVESFQEFFDIRHALTPEEKADAFRIRYRVYCEDMQYEPAAQFPDKLEHDEFDDHAVHCLVIHRRSGKPAACVRLVEAGEGVLLPFEKYCRDSLFTGYAQDLYTHRDTICEFSRMAIDREFRRRPGENHTRLGEVDALDCSHLESRTFSLIGIATTLAVFALAELSGRTRVFAMMEHHLPRLLKVSGILIQQAGESVEYHGKRAPYYTTTGQVVENMRPPLRRLYDSIYRDFANQIKAGEKVA